MSFDEPLNRSLGNPDPPGTNRPIRLAALSRLDRESHSRCDLGKLFLGNVEVRTQLERSHLDEPLDGSRPDAFVRVPCRCQFAQKPLDDGDGDGVGGLVFCHGGKLLVGVSESNE